MKVETVCVDGPLSGERKAITGTSFLVPVRRPMPKPLSTYVAGQADPEAVPFDTAVYRLVSLPYDELPQTPTGGVDYDKLHWEDARPVQLLWDKAHYNIPRRCWQYWSCHG